MRSLALCLLVAATPLRAGDGGVSHCAVPGFRGVLVAGAGLYVGAEQDQEQLHKLRTLGVKLVIDLRPDEGDAGMPEARLAASAGLDYRRVVVRGAEDLTSERARALEAAIKTAKGEPVLVHCSTGNRAAALLALRDALVRGQSREASLSFMRRSGLIKLESAVSAELDRQHR